MTKNQKLFSFCILFLFIGAFGFGWNWFLKFNTCQNQDSKISSLTEIQDQWLYSYGYFSALKLDDENLNNLKKIIGMREVFIKKQVEFFSKHCKSKTHKDRLMSILNGFNNYLTAKAVLFKEDQSYQWSRNLVPFEYIENL